MKKIVSFAKNHIGDIVKGAAGLTLLGMSFMGIKSDKIEDCRDDDSDLLILNGDGIEDLSEESSEE